MKRRYTAIDLFSGAGGLSEGFMQSGEFEFLAHVEWELPMVKTLRKNLVSRWGYTEDDAKKTVIHFDMQKTSELIHGKWSDETINEYSKHNDKNIINSGLLGLSNNKPIDIIIGGPPCQAYSIAGRAQDPDSMKFDYRNYLFESFVEVVKSLKPKVFVFENVPGILSAKPGDKLVIERIYEAFKEIGYIIRKPKKMKSSTYSSADYNVPQKRNRVIIFGVKKEYEDLLEKLYSSLDKVKSNKPEKTVRDAIGFLPKLLPIENHYKEGRSNISHEATDENTYSMHSPRYHNARDIKAFKKWISNDMNNVSSREKLDFYFHVTGKRSNHNKYRNLEWDKPSPTIVAHLYKDGLMFIHPDVEQLRSITVREAALLQSFPIDYEFIGSQASAYKMIGNAVPVQFAKKIAEAIVNVFKEGL